MTEPKIVKEPACPYCGTEDLTCNVHRYVASYVTCKKCGKTYITERAWDKDYNKVLGFCSLTEEDTLERINVNDK